MYFKHRNLQLKKTHFKKRYIRYSNYDVTTDSITIYNKIFLELNILKLILVNLKRLYKKKKYKLYLNLKPNHLLTKKPKNARMGKGKGKVDRFVYKIKPFTNFIKVSGLSKIRFNKLKVILNR